MIGCAVQEPKSLCEAQIGHLQMPSLVLLAVRLEDVEEMQKKLNESAENIKKNIDCLSVKLQTIHVRRVSHRSLGVWLIQCSEHVPNWSIGDPDCRNSAS